MGVNTCLHLERTAGQSKVTTLAPFGLHAPDSSQNSNCMTLITQAEAGTRGISVTETCTLSPSVSVFLSSSLSAFLVSAPKLFSHCFLELPQNAKYVYAN